MFSKLYNIPMYFEFFIIYIFLFYFSLMIFIISQLQF